MERKLKEVEVEEVISTVNSYSQGYNPRILYTLVDKNTSLRLFEKENGECVNPAPGTCVDSGLVEVAGEEKFDFFLIPHKATVATARPVHYNVIYNSTGVKKKDIE